MLTCAHGYPQGPSEHRAWGLPCARHPSPASPSSSPALSVLRATPRQAHPLAVRRGRAGRLAPWTLLPTFSLLSVPAPVPGSASSPVCVSDHMWVHTRAHADEAERTRENTSSPSRRRRPIRPCEAGGGSLGSPHATSHHAHFPSCPQPLQGSPDGSHLEKQISNLHRLTPACLPKGMALCRAALGMGQLRPLTKHTPPGTCSCPDNRGPGWHCPCPLWAQQRGGRRVGAGPHPGGGASQDPAPTTCIISISVRRGGSAPRPRTSGDPSGKHRALDSRDPSVWKGGIGEGDNS